MMKKDLDNNKINIEKKYRKDNHIIYEDEKETF